MPRATRRNPRQSAAASAATSAAASVASDSDFELPAPPRRGRRGARVSDDEDFEAVAKSETPESDDQEAIPETPALRALGKGTSRQKRQPSKAGTSTVQDPTTLTPYPVDSRLTSTRVYHGIFQKLLRTYFYEDYYGPDPDATAAAVDLFRRWIPFDVLPARALGGEGSSVPSPWIPEGFEAAQSVRMSRWYRQQHEAVERGLTEGSHTEVVSREVAAPYTMRPGRDITLLMGSHQQALPLHQPVAFDETGSVLDGSDAAGWVFDVGGLVLSVAWAPRPPEAAQILALAVSPFADQDFDAFREDNTPAEDHYHRGSVQIWSLLDTTPTPRLRRTLLFPWGRAKKLLWCPAAPSDGDHVGLLAMMCADGLVHVVDIHDMADADDDHELIHRPLVSLGFPREEDSRVTSFAWAGINRLVTGHQDGSIALWSVTPRVCLFRQAVHHTHVLHLATGYPSQPQLVASHPVSGLSAFIDLANPASEIATTTNPNITPHHGMLEWSDHLQGFVSTVPSSKPLNTAVGFFHSRTFPATPRKVIEGDVLISALAVGVHHPFVLAALLDGSVWACNPMNRVFLPRHAPPGWKMKIFQHEHVPSARFGRVHPAPADEAVRATRGISRVLQGFAPVTNQGSKAIEFAATGQASGAKGKRKVRTKTKKPGDEGGAEDDDDTTMYADPSKLVVHEPLSRVAAMAWNPNLERATWAVFGMASGLVRVQDLGIDGDGHEE